ncbi:MAG: gamma-glutamyltransferase [Xanthobacteraceae bacterium]|jgi:gamma-glutamyltranspeptidase/glutathione hydrolase|nr:gamma-glutamyltransferase [Xanthobacteraceae bacterium]
MSIPQSGPTWPHLDAYEQFPQLAGHRPVLGTRGMVSSPHAMASTIGCDVLKAGGNAVDAAIATSAALMVACPMQCGPGGDAFWLIAEPSGEVHALDASGRASRHADAGRLLAQGHPAIPPRSGFAVTAPGAIDGWSAAHRRFASQPLAGLLEPAAALAEGGVVVSRHLHASFQICTAELAAKDALRLWGGKGPRVYDRLKQPALAALLRGIGRNGAGHFYGGAMAGAVARAVATAGGWLDEADLAAHASDWVAPLQGRFRDLDVLTTPPSSQGFSLLMALGFVESVPSGTGRFELANLHLEIEAVAAALAERDAINDDRARLAVPIERTWGSERRVAFARAFGMQARSVAGMQGTDRITRGDTAHLCVVDGSGMAVSLIQSLFFDFGACIPVPEGGFVLQNRGAAFTLDGPVARLAPGMRPPNTLMPTIALREGKPAIVLGCMGGDGQMQAQLQLLLDLCDGGLDPQQAVSRPRWYLDRSAPGGPRLMMEDGLDEVLIDGLRGVGHKVERLGRFEDRMGHAQIIAIRDDGVLVGAADPRSDGQVAAF